MVSSALRRAARLGPFFTLLLPDDDWPDDVNWQSFARLSTPEAVDLLAHQVEATAHALNTDQQRPIASLLHLGAAATICSPLLATAAADALVPDIDPAALQFGYPPTGRLQLALTGLLASPPRTELLPELADQLIDVAIERLLGAFTAALTTAVPLPEPVLTGNIFSSLAAAARLIEPAGAGVRARALVDLVARRYPPLHDAGELEWRSPDPATYFRRRNCCLFYQVPGGGKCGDCILAS
jgi:iron complex transport system ATP-binding protein